jgi:prepilin-type N-terminal cleavage/methylation domain-containing protein/prepilin-type processing-associated H-X9-DG protein
LWRILPFVGVQPAYSSSVRARGCFRMRKPRAFSMVELLAVVGIISVLIAILVPALNRARESAKRVDCLSNLHQLGTAFVMYCNDNRGQFPRPAPQGTTGGIPPMPHDWIHWNWGRQLKDSAIVRYLGSATPTHFRCPGDDVDYRPHDLGGFATEGVYRYSYSMNVYLSRGIAPPSQCEAICTRVRRPSEKILLAEEDSETIDDGLWLPDEGPGVNLLSIRHDSARVSSSGTDDDGNIRMKDRKGNVSFVDGHSEAVTRAFAHDPRHYFPRE